MKKLLQALLIVIFAESLILNSGFSVYAACNYSTTSSIWDLQNKSFSDLVPCATPDQAVTTALSPLQIINLISGFIAKLTIFIAIVAIIVGVIMLVTSAGDKNKATTGKNVIRDAFIALILAITATQILNLILKQLGLEI